MYRRTVLLLFTCLCAARLSLHAQEFKLFDRQVQIHGFASQGFVYTNDNNWLTMHTSAGSEAFTDFGANVSMQVAERLRIGAQIYDHNIGNLGEWHPSLDWAFADYRFKPWFGIRGGKVKTIIGLGRELHMRVTVEGVETAEQAAFLELVDGDQAQGFFFGRPVPASEIAAGILAEFRSPCAPVIEPEAKLRAVR